MTDDTGKEDWEEPECCFRPHIAAAEAVHTGSADGGPSVREVIQGFDRLLDRDAKREAAIYLEDWMARYEEAGDWASQITILNEMMGFTAIPERGKRALRRWKRGWPWWEIMGFPRLSPAAPPVSMPPLP